MRRGPILAAGAVVAAAGFITAAAAVGNGAADANAAATRTVVLDDLDFKPARITIARGTTVRWVWRDGNTPHDVTSRGSKRFRSSGIKKSGSHQVVFRRAGTYRYVCTIHPNMLGRVVVR